MDTGDFVELLVVLSVVVLPVLAITTRFALKPIVDAILRLKEGGVLNPTGTSTSVEINALREELSELRREVATLREAEAFHRALGEGAAREPARLGSPEGYPGGPA